MKSFDTGVSQRVLASVTVACIITIGVFAAAVYLPGLYGGPTDPTDPGGSLGSRVASFLTTRADDVEFYWMSNCTLVNEDLTQFYDSQHSGAFVDGVYVNRSGSNHEIVVVFSPYDENTTGRGEISVSQWTSITAAIVDNGIGEMESAGSEAPENFPSAFPPTLYFSIFFNDNTCFFGGFSSTDGFMYVRNGTWSGGFYSHGHPHVTGWDPDGVWLIEDGHMSSAMFLLYSTITAAVSYP
jgi:hypothetical protein